MALQPNSGPGLPLWGFLTITFFTELVQCPTPNLEDQASVFMTPGDRVAQLYPRHWVRILVAFYDMHGLQWNYFLIPANTREISLLGPDIFVSSLFCNALYVSSSLTVADQVWHPYSCPYNGLNYTLNILSIII
jgi:hypothetical protein